MLCSPYLNSPFLYIYLSFWHFCAQLRNIWFRNLWVSLGYEEVYEVTLRLMFAQVPDVGWIWGVLRGLVDSQDCILGKDTIRTIWIILSHSSGSFNLNN